jgi:hypothetical protein
MFKLNEKFNALLIAVCLMGSVSCASYNITGKKKNKKKETVDDGKKVQEPGSDIVFDINVNPLQPAVMQGVTFNGSCSRLGANGTMSWNFGDGQVGEGFQTGHQYGAVGTYQVEAICQIAGLEPLVRNETINVVASTGNPGQTNGGTIGGACGCQCCPG